MWGGVHAIQRPCVEDNLAGVGLVVGWDPANARWHAESQRTGPNPSLNPKSGFELGFGSVCRKGRAGLGADKSLDFKELWWQQQQLLATKKEE